VCCIGHYLWAQRVLPYSLEWREIGKVLLGSLGMAITTSATLTLALPSWLSLALACTTGALTYLLFALWLDIAATRRHLKQLLAKINP
jgi:type VI protein secretion system component VasF